MTFQTRLLAASAFALLLAGSAAQAMPTAEIGNDNAQATPITQVGFHWFGDDDRGRGDDDDRRGSHGYRGDDDDDDDDGGKNMIRQQSATPPSNGLFNPGSTPAVQSN
ncbi:hypothetical protein [Rhizobium sp. L1K21]|uniref:hypothetical protein n=1 Tax=Rhizobium sp. L1K21 TaxID=2954933 RepID=UPI002093EC8D|nr:hypothetical protein [Rhizobium sp. L1K21]MCO6187049.1 hypothetical protein [Rhizobium sp. L1K21]